MGFEISRKKNKRNEMSNHIEEKINDYLLQLDMSYESIGERMWVIHDEFDQIDNIVVSLEEPLLIFRVKLMGIPKEGREEFFEKLLRLNTESLVHGAYGLEGDDVVIVDILEVENLDLNEFQASLEGMIMAIGADYQVLSKYL